MNQVGESQHVSSADRISPIKHRTERKIIATIVVSIVIISVTALGVGLLTSNNARESGHSLIGTELGLVADSRVAINPEQGIPCTGPQPSQCYAYTFAVTFARGEITWNDFRVLVRLAGSGSPVPIGNFSEVGIAGFAVCASSCPKNSTTQDLAYAVGNIEDQWTENPAQSRLIVSENDTLVAYVAGSTTNADPIHGDSLVIVGTGIYSGTIEALVY